MPRLTETQLERALEHALFERGLAPIAQHRVPYDVRRTIDLAFPAEKVAIFADGCYWHACPEHGARPIRNQTYWDDAWEMRRASDIEINLRLAAAGWAVVRVWEHENLVDASRAITDLVRSRRKR